MALGERRRRDYPGKRTLAGQVRRVALPLVSRVRSRKARGQDPAHARREAKSSHGTETPIMTTTVCAAIAATAPVAPLLRRLHAARAHSDALFALVRPEFLFERPIAERHRLAFYIGHLEAFDWNLLAPLAHETGDSELDRLFAFGIDPVDGALPQDRVEDWPPLAAIHDYRDTTRARVDALLQATAFTPQLTHLWHIALEHRLMHAETLCYLLHQLPHAAKFARPRRHATPHDAAPAATIAVPAGDVTLGLPRDAATFGWDNEFEAHTLHVPSFTIDACKVSNGQFLAFVEAGGYDQRSCWSDADWAWRSAHDITHPAFWVRAGDGWAWRSMFELLPLPRDWPVYVSHAEASAYARWCGGALPSEAQWQRAAAGSAAPAPDGDDDDFDPRPVHGATLPRSACGALGMVGNGWEWTRTAFAPFAGFVPFDAYRGYSAPFFDGRHFVLKGGSVRTAAPLLRPSFRNWFQPHYPYVYAGLRCVDRVRGDRP